MRQLLLDGGVAPESGDNAAVELRRARVIVERPMGVLDYTIPSRLDDALIPGSPVRVPLGRQTVGGYVVAVETGPGPEGVKLKPVTDIDDERPTLPAELLSLIVFIGEYYFASAGDVLAAALPAMARRGSVRYTLAAKGEEIADTLKRGAPAGDKEPEGNSNLPESKVESKVDSKVASIDAVILALAATHRAGFTVAAVEKATRENRRLCNDSLRRLVRKGWIERKTTKASGGRKIAAFQRTPLADQADEYLSARQRGARALLEYIPEHGTITAAELSQIDTGAYSKLKTLQKLGLIVRSTETVRVRPADEPQQLGGDSEIPEPTPEQADAIALLHDALATEKFTCCLLEGVTGSGKTEVYLRLIEKALDMGRTALVLVPEIALTPQLGARFRSRFGDRVATFHSGLTVAERRDEWERIASKQAVIGLGARSAIFLPLENIGVIVVDEEHETSFKQDETPRYNARDLAVYRGTHSNAVVVLGSATPSLESRHNVSTGRYVHIRLRQRVHARPMPSVECIDLASAKRIGDGIFTEPLAEALTETLAKGEQAILFLNRRGFAPYVYCRDCGIPFRCDDCDVSLTLHRRRDLLMCHYCGFEMPTPEACPACSGLSLDAHGLGTERLEAELRVLFGDVPIARLDRDTVRRRTDIDEQLGKFRSGEAKILIGTQMVAKGHDFPGVTLVGVIAADGSLNLPDFRAAERTFQLLTQVAGRAGRGEKPGRVLVQAYEVNHYAVEAASRHDYPGFVEQELQAREELGYPPFTRVVLLRLEGNDEQQTMSAAEQVLTKLRTAAGKVSSELMVLGPAWAPLARLRGIWRAQIMMRGSSRPDLRNALHQARLTTPRDVRLVLDVDPVNML